ncbi:protein MAIN-LIKE 2-like [Rutidosis leptorrhynchoides]|uniref:protein MAIN-LIKE 2-like n=1 Tax=Rutidosis leptorrhynchoides TaxID=125765 RepID=UPI003A99B426
MDDETIMEEREELMVKMVSPDPTKPQHPTRKIARFLKPTATSVDLQRPISPNHSSVPKIQALKVSFNGWRTPPKGWKDWVDSMHSVHKSTWTKAGIHDAILNSCYEITKDENLLLGFAEKWCDQTKSFVFVWGEVTISLEDMMVIGGYPVLGKSIFSNIEDESETVIAKLKKARSEITKDKYNKVYQFGWLKKFKDSGSEIEHEAFLALWLSRFVFPCSFSTVSKNVTNIAIHLARGTKLALAPAVLASIYRDLRLLNTSIVTDETPVIVWAPLQLVQIWIWERFGKIRPNPGSTCNPRFEKWEKKKRKLVNIGSIDDCAFEDFCWQPYDDSVFSNIYQKKGRWVVIDDCLDEELESWARCLRVSELVGIDKDCIEQYLPHRVAMQFGLNQDVPGDVARTNESPEIAWGFYSRPVKDSKLYVPSRLSEPYVTARYLEWRNKSTETCCFQSSSMGNNDTENIVKDDSGTEGSKISMGKNAAAVAAADGDDDNDDDDDDGSGGGGGGDEDGGEHSHR